MTGNLSLNFFSCPPPSKKQGKLVNIEDCTQKDAWPALHAEILCYARLPLHKYSQLLRARVSEGGVRGVVTSPLLGTIICMYFEKRSNVNVGPTNNISNTIYLVGLMKDVV